ncbi:hypothetical protein [Cohnella nanjingensis]|uniref:Uncharacterized protein n=1 Tax=Cohnella nanjingensis TaxID=1387779 RepID=A0A7X0RS56_9BACL|nr:hypothetical protein [Cohnella nanjingensis]MBB6672493.1 hypothetical protein [Cohnella nanjingensis]
MTDGMGYRVDRWGGIDGLGRRLPTRIEVGPSRPNRFVGLFYFLWLGQHGTMGPYDNSDIVAGWPEAMRDRAHAAWGPEGAFHFWGEPLYGYYLNDDAWVLRKHVQLIASAGVDFLVFDTTNATTYKRVYDELFRIMAELAEQGFKIPQFAFYTNTDSGETIAALYRDIYQPARYPSLWFRWEGKPLIIGDPEACDAEHHEFFTFRLNQWPNEPAKTNGFPWIEFERPQRVFFNDRGEKEIVSVSVAQHPSVAMSDTPFYGYGDNWGRGYHEGADSGAAASAEAIHRGANVAEQWAFALAEDPRIVFVTGWNEWVAMRLSGPDERPVLFVDQATLNFSRDIEPMKGGYNDNYYMHLIGYIRRFKGMPDDTFGGSRLAAPIPMAPDFRAWDDVASEYRDFAGDTAPRNHPGYGELRYRDDTGRNDLALFKAAHTEDEVCFYARTRAALTPRTDRHWMMLLLRVPGRADEGWEGYHYIVNRQVTGDSATLLERSAGGWNWEPLGEVRYAASGNELHLALPRTLLGLVRSEQPQRLEFKWVDHMQNEGDAMDFYRYGDVAPEGRLNYVYTIQGEA